MRKLGFITILLTIICTTSLFCSEFIENSGTYSDGLVELRMSECSVYNIQDDNYLHNEWVEFELEALEGYSLSGPGLLIIDDKEYTFEALNPDKKGKYQRTRVLKLDINEVSYINTFTLIYHISPDKKMRSMKKTRKLVVKAHDLEAGKNGEIILNFSSEGGFTIEEQEE